MAITTLEIVQYGFAGAVTVSCVRYLRSGHVKEDFSVFQDRRALDWVEVVIGGIVCLAIILAAGKALDYGPKALQDILNWSWLKLLLGKNDNSQVGNLMLSGAKIPYFGLAFVPLLFVNLPSLARAEEDMFRDGTKNWIDAIPRSLKFGLMHMIVGVPLWIGLILAIPGMWFTHQYFKGGITRSTMAHSVYNMMLATGLFAAILIYYIHR